MAQSSSAPLHFRLLLQRLLSKANSQSVHPASYNMTPLGGKSLEMQKFFPSRAVIAVPPPLETPTSQVIPSKRSAELVPLLGHSQVTSQQTSTPNLFPASLIFSSSTLPSAFSGTIGAS